LEKKVRAQQYTPVLPWIADPVPEAN